jgi:ABC-type Mn2+/Zn2+ transport system permease subunit
VSRLIDAWRTGFFRRAMLEALVVGAVAGAVGAHVLIRRLSFFVVAISHATFPGVVIAAALGLGMSIGASVAGLVVVVVIVVVGRRSEVAESTLTGVVLAGAFALGVVVQSARPGGARQLTAFLVGSILTVTNVDLALTIVVGTLALMILVAAHKELVLGAFDRDGARAVGYQPAVLDLVAMVAVLMAMVVAIPAVGTLLAIALLIVPALTARTITDRFGLAMVLGAVIGAACGVLGLAVSTMWRAAAGASVVLVSGAAFVIALVARALVDAVRRRDALQSVERPSPVGSPA